MRTLLTISLSTLLFVGCGDDGKQQTPINPSTKQPAATKTSVNETLSLEQAIEAVAEKPSHGERFIPAETIRAFDIAGIHLGMSQAEAEAKLKQDNWQGKFAKLDNNSLQDLSVRAFEQDGKELFLFRNRIEDGSLHIGEIEFVQHYELEHLESDISKALIDKYGTPTINNGGRLIWRVRHEGLNDIRNGVGDASANHVCYRTSDPQKCLTLLPKLEVESRHGAQLVADIKPKEVTLSLSDKSHVQKEIAAVKALKNKAIDEQRKENGKEEEVGF